jgi:predicted ArsR family transcriptional regulator
MANNINELLNELHEQLVELQQDNPDEQSAYFKTIIQETITFVDNLKARKFTLNPKEIKKHKRELEAAYRQLEKLFDHRPKRGIPQVLYQDPQTLEVIQDHHSAKLIEKLLAAINSLRQLANNDRALALILRTADRKLSKTEQLMRFRLARYRHNQEFVNPMSDAKVLAQRIDINCWFERFAAEDINWTEIFNDLNILIKDICAKNLPNKVPYYGLDEGNPNDAAVLDFFSKDIAQPLWQQLAVIFSEIENKHYASFSSQEDDAQKFRELKELVMTKLAFKSSEAKIEQAVNILSGLAKNTDTFVQEQKPGFFTGDVTKFEYQMLRRIQYSLELAEKTFNSVKSNPHTPTADQLLGQQIRVVLSELDVVIGKVNDYKTDKGKSPQSCAELAKLFTDFQAEIQRDVDNHFPAQAVAPMLH